MRSVSAVTVVLSSLILLCSCGGEPSSVLTNDFRELTVSQAAEAIQAQQGEVRVVLLYAAYCPACRHMFPEFVASAETWRQKNVKVLAFSTDDSDSMWRRYLGPSSLPFARMRILPWPKGQLDRALRPTGIDIGDSYGIPLIAVIDRDGHVVGQREGVDGVDRVEEWLTSLGI